MSAGTFFSTIRDNFDLSLLLTLKRIGHLFFGPDASPENDLAILQHGPQIEMERQSQQHQDRHPDDYLYLHPQTKGIKSTVKPKKRLKPRDPDMDDLEVARATPVNLEKQLEKAEKEENKQKDKLAYALRYNGYTEEELENLLERAKSRERKKTKELKEHDEGYYTPEKIEKRIAKLNKREEALQTEYEITYRDGGDIAEVKAQLSMVRRNQTKEKQSLREAHGEVYSEPQDSREQIVDKIEEAQARIELAKVALRDLQETKQAAQEGNENPKVPSDIKYMKKQVNHIQKQRDYQQHRLDTLPESANDYTRALITKKLEGATQELPRRQEIFAEQIAELRSEVYENAAALPTRLLRGTKNHVKELVTGEYPKIGRDAAMDRVIKAGDQQVLEERMEAAAEHTKLYISNKTQEPRTNELRLPLNEEVMATLQKSKNLMRSDGDTQGPGQESRPHIIKSRNPGAKKADYSPAF